MAVETFERVKPLLFAHEGGYSDHRDDPGNWSSGKVGVGRLIGTKYGIAAPTLIGNRDFTVRAEHMRALTREEAIAIYKAQYWDTVRGDDLPAGVDYCVYDYSVNSGPARASQELQRVVGADVDGVIGPKTLAAISQSGMHPTTIIDKICDRRLAFMKRLKTWKYFGRGWSRRVADVRTASKRFVANQPAPDHAIEEAPIPKAKPKDKDGLQAWKTPDGLSKLVGLFSGMGAILSGSGPAQWALAAVFVIAAVTGAYLAIRHFKEAE